MESTDCDALVVGGGPGASSAAAFARLRGLPACPVEREEFPSFPVGEYLLAIAACVELKPA